MSTAPKVSFTTLGCRLNQAESDSMAEELFERGFERGNEAPDVVVVNTCTVTKEATKASRTAIRRAVKSNPEAKVVVIGCYAVSNPDDVQAIDGVDVVLDNLDKERFADALADRRATRPLLQIGSPKRPAPVTGPPRVRANLKLQTGCDEWCTFCIIPTTRGPLRSMDEDDLVREAKARVATGARELVLTGVHLGKYSYDHGGDERDLVRLIRRFLDIDGVARVRLSSIFPRHLTEELLDLFRTDPRMCRYLHVPLQAGHDDVLVDMHRPYDIAEYIESVQRAKEAISGLALATDIIVGFPGETDEQFESTLDVVRRVGFSKLHVFRYSPRPGTPAADMADQVPIEVKKERSKRLIDLGNRLRKSWLERHLGVALEVLVEDKRTVDGVEVCSGQTDDYVRVWFEGGAELGSMALVNGDRIRADGIDGTLIEGKG